MENYEKTIQRKEISPESRCVEKSITETNNIISNMLILTTEDVLKTYSEYEADSARKYSEYLKLKEANPTFGYKKLAKMLGVSISRTRCWKQWNGKPTAILAIEKLTQAGLLPLYSDNPKLLAILRLLGAGFTDGGIDKHLNTFHFNSAIKKNIETWENDFKQVFTFAQNSLSYIQTGKYGSSIGARTCDRAVVRFFAALGCPVGNKTIVTYDLPNWIFELSANYKLAFIDGFFSCEVAMPQYSCGSRTWWHFVNFSLSLSKIEEKEAEHLQFLKKLCDLCDGIGVKYTSIARVPQPKIKDGKPRRKDNKTCDSYKILFSNSIENILLAHKSIPLTYAVEKKQRFDNAVKTYKQRHVTVKSETCANIIDVKNSHGKDSKEESFKAKALVL